MTIRTLLLGFLIGTLTTNILVYALYPAIGYRWFSEEWKKFADTHPEAGLDPGALAFDRYYAQQESCPDVLGVAMGDRALPNPIKGR